MVDEEKCGCLIRSFNFYRINRKNKTLNYRRCIVIISQIFGYPRVELFFYFSMPIRCWTNLSDDFFHDHFSITIRYPSKCHAQLLLVVQWHYGWWSRLKSLDLKFHQQKLYCSLCYHFVLIFRIDSIAFFALLNKVIGLCIFWQLNRKPIVN